MENADLEEADISSLQIPDMSHDGSNAGHVLSLHRPPEQYHDSLLFGEPESKPSPTALESQNVSYNPHSFHRWLYCVCLVKFDLDVGQVLEYTFPNVPLSDREKRDM